MTTSRSVSPSSRSTNGRAPSISSNMRFWINAVSLNRPPTLFTISSLLSASIIVVLESSRRFLVTDQAGDLFNRPVHVVINYHVVERPAALGHPDLALGAAEAFFHLLRRFAAALLK